MRRPPPLLDVPRRRLSVDEVLRMVAGGILDEDEHIELLDGDLVVVRPPGPPEASRISELCLRLTSGYPESVHVRARSPLESGLYSLPEPDLAVVRGKPLDYRERHPLGRDTLVVIEMARNSDAIDDRKVSIYAAASVPVYWLIDLPRHRLKVFSQPTAGGRYELQQVLGPDQEVGLPGLDVRWRVDSLVD